MNVLAIDLGGTHANCGIVRDQRVLCSQVVRISGDGRLEQELPVPANTLRDLAVNEKLRLSDFDGVAVGFCGLVNRAERRVISTNSKYEDAPDLDLPSFNHVSKFSAGRWVFRASVRLATGLFDIQRMSGSNQYHSIAFGTNRNNLDRIDQMEVCETV